MSPPTIKHRWKIYSHDESFNRFDFAVGVYKDRYIMLAGGYMLESTVLLDVPYSRIRAQVQNDQRSNMDKSVRKRTSSVKLPDLPHLFHQLSCYGTILGDYFYVVNDYNEIYRIYMKHYIQQSNPIDKQQTTSYNDIIKQRDWEKVSNDEICFGGGPSVISDGKLLYIFKNICKTYNPSSQIWTLLPPMKTPRHYHAAVKVRNRIYVIGGKTYSKFQQEELLSTIEIYNIDTKVWITSTDGRETPSLPFAVSSSAATVISNRWILCTGGYNVFGNKSGHCFYLDTLDHHPKWVKCSIQISPSRAEHACVFLEACQTILLIGGYQNDYRGKSIQMMERKYLIPNWYIVKDFILLRRLWEKGLVEVPEYLYQNMDIDAASLQQNYNWNNIKQSTEFETTNAHERKVDEKFATLVWKLIAHLNVDMFRTILSFLL